MRKLRSGYSMQVLPIRTFYQLCALVLLSMILMLIGLILLLQNPETNPVLKPIAPVQVAAALDPVSLESETQSRVHRVNLPVITISREVTPESSPTPTSKPTSTDPPLEPADDIQADEVQQEPDCDVADGFPDSILQWCEVITVWSNRRELDPNLIAALILVESGGNPSAISRSGAVGLMQVMPRDGIAAGFMCPNGPCFANRPTIDELLDPEFNIEYGTGMLAGLIGRYGERDGLKRYGPARNDYSYVNLIYNTMQKYADHWWWLWHLR